MPKLYIAEPAGESVYEIFDDEVSLGRGAANGIQIADSHASKNHALVRRIQGHWKVIDLESKNGVRVNGRFRNQHWLADGDALTIGVATLRFAAEGAPEGSPAAAGAVAQAPLAAVPAPVPAVPAVPQAPTPASAAPAAEFQPVAPAPTRRGAAPAARRRTRPVRDEGYDSEYDDDLPPPRRRSNSSSIVVLGIIGVVAFVVIFLLIAAGGTAHNDLVWQKASKMADKRNYQDALVYAQKHGDPDGTAYHRLVRAMNDWKKRAQAQKDLERSKEARDHLDYQIYRKQDITEGHFRAKNALPVEEVVRLLREFLIKYKGTPASHELMHSEHSGYPMLREAMREYASEDLKAVDIMGAAQTELGIAQSRGKYGQTVLDLIYMRDMNRLCMTAENWKKLRNLVDDEIEAVKSKARRAFEDDKMAFEKYRKNGQRGKALHTLSEMREKYNGIPELVRGVKELESRL